MNEPIEHRTDQQQNIIGFSKEKLKQYKYSRTELIGSLVGIIVVLDFLVSSPSNFGFIPISYAHKIHISFIMILLILAIAVTFGLISHKFSIICNAVLLPNSYIPSGPSEINKAPHELSISIKYETKDAFVVGREIKASVMIVPNLSLQGVKEKVEKTRFIVEFPFTQTEIIGPYSINSSILLDPATSPQKGQKAFNMYGETTFIRTQPGMLIPCLVFMDNPPSRPRSLDPCMIPIEQLSVMHTLMNNRIVLGLSILVIALTIINFR